MNYKNLIAGSLLIGTLFTGCQDELPGPDAKELYTRAFIKQFGIASHTPLTLRQTT